MKFNRRNRQQYFTTCYLRVLVMKSQKRYHIFCSCHKYFMLLFVKFNISTPLLILRVCGISSSRCYYSQRIKFKQNQVHHDARKYSWYGRRPAQRYTNEQYYIHQDVWRVPEEVVQKTAKQKEIKPTRQTLHLYRWRNPGKQQRATSVQWFLRDHELVLPLEKIITLTGQND